MRLTASFVRFSAAVAEAEVKRALVGPASPAPRRVIGSDGIDRTSSDRPDGLLRKPAISHGDNRWKTLDDGRVVAHQYDRLSVLG